MKRLSSMHSPIVRKRQNCQIQRLPSPNTSDFAYKTKCASTLDNLANASRTTPAQARGLDKLNRPAILTPVEVTTLNTGQHLSELGGLCTIQGSQSGCGKLHSTPIHTSTLHVSPGPRAQTYHPQQPGFQIDRLSLSTSLFEY